MGYTETVLTYLPNLLELDSSDLKIKRQENISSNELTKVSFVAPELQSARKSEQSYNSYKPPRYESEPSKYESPFTVKPVKVEFTPVQVPLKLHEKDTLIQHLNFELQSTKNHLIDIENDKSEALTQIESVKSHYDKIVCISP
jgi:hypothetical protein